LCRVVRCSHHAPPPRMRREGRTRRLPITRAPRGQRAPHHERSSLTRGPGADTKKSVYSKLTTERICQL
jgi:hypothetical protein